MSAALAQTIAQGMAPPVSMAPVAVSIAPVAVSMAQALPGITMSHATYAHGVLSHRQPEHEDNHSATLRLKTGDSSN
ncbi:hypothetical protein WMY93_011705 [Mugilogobius chulae]|uniref:Uncharacterized protein n=1 Tax=Mugilogobius chulae TaxID=88201 RepID=A0AAW0PDD9_9GOBI